MRPPRGLSVAEAELWARVARTVAPINSPRAELVQGVRPPQAPAATSPTPNLSPEGEGSLSKPLPFRGGVGAGHVTKPEPPRPLTAQTLDGSWERKLARAGMAPDFTLDLHGYTLDTAHARLTGGIALAIAQQARLVLVIAGKPRPVDAADRGTHRGAIRAKLLDWLAAGPHARQIAAVRPAHPRHGGAGAVYVVLRRSA